MVQASQDSEWLVLADAGDRMLGSLMAPLAAADLVRLAVELAIAVGGCTAAA